MRIKVLPKKASLCLLQCTHLPKRMNTLYEYSALPFSSLRLLLWIILFGTTRKSQFSVPHFIHLHGSSSAKISQAALVFSALLLSLPSRLLSSLLLSLFFLTPFLFLFPLPQSFKPQSSSLPVSFTLYPSPDGFRLVGLVAGVTARLSDVASDQGGRRPARTIGAERLRLTAGHLSRAISVGAEARLPLVGPAYCEDQRQSVSTLHSAFSPSVLSHFCLQPSLSLPPVFLCCRSISVSFPSIYFSSSQANGCCLAICYQTVQLLFITHSFTYLL